MLSLSPAQAQGGHPGGGSWQSVHCDAEGKDIPNDKTSGPYPLQGIQTVTNFNTYLQRPIDPSYPQGSYTIETMSASEGDSRGDIDYGIGFDGYFDQMRAPNFESDAYGHWVGAIAYTDSSGHSAIAGPWNGQVQHDANGQILTYFQWRFLNTSNHMPIPPPAGSLPPDHMDILLKTQLSAYTDVVNGAYAEAWASDGAPFLETATSGLPVSGQHVVRAATGLKNIMEVYLNGQVHMLTRNQIPFTPNGAAQATAWAFVSATAAQDGGNREVTLYRDGQHGDYSDANGTVHGDTRYSYGTGTGLGAMPVLNVQYLHPNFSGTWSPDPSGQWAPKAVSPYMDSDTTHPQLADIGNVWANGQSDGWSGQTDSPKSTTITYTATDSDGVAATAQYVLTEHDQYENWHRVSSQGGPIAPQAKGDLGSVMFLAESAPTKPNAKPVLTPGAIPVPLIVDGLTVGGVFAGGGAAWALVPEALDPPLWPGVLLTLAGLTLQTVSSIPVDTQPLSPPDTFNAAFLETAYQNYVYDQTAAPGEEGDNDNLVDSSFFHLLQQNSDFAGYDNGQYAPVTIVTTLGQQMVNYYFQADKYDNGGKLTNPATGSAVVPGNTIWSYLWDCTGAPTTPSQPTH